MGASFTDNEFPFTYQYWMFVKQWEIVLKVYGTLAYYLNEGLFWNRPYNTVSPGYHSVFYLLHEL